MKPNTTPGNHVRYLMQRLAAGHGAYTQEIVDCWKHDMGRDLPPDFPEIRVERDPLRRDTYVVSFIQPDGTKIDAAAAQALIDGWPARRYAAHKARARQLGWREARRARGARRRARR